MDKDLRARITAQLEQGLTNQQIAIKERVSAMTVANVRRYNADPSWHHRTIGDLIDNGDIAVEASPEDTKRRVLLDIAEMMIRAADLIGVSVESVYADKSGNAIVEGTNRGERVKFEVNVFAK